MHEFIFVAGLGLFFLCALALLVGGLAAFLVVYGRRAKREISAVWAETAVAAGLTRMDKEGQRPFPDAGRGQRRLRKPM